MKDYLPLKTKKIYGETKLWISRNIDFKYDQPSKELYMYLNNEALVSGYGTLIGACSQLAFWYENLFITNAFEEKEDSFSHLQRSFKYDFLAFQIASATLKNRGLLFRQHGLIISKGFALGCFHDCEILGQTALTNLNKQLYAGLEFHKVPFFILNLFSLWKFGLWKGVDYPELSDLPQCYRTILRTWRDEKPNNLEKALLEACDYHIEESRSDTAKKYYEFDVYTYRVFPAEILAVLQLRKSLNLEIPKIEHDLFTLPTVRLSEEPEFKDALFEEVKEKVSKELNFTT